VLIVVKIEKLGQSKRSVGENQYLEGLNGENSKIELLKRPLESEKTSIFKLYMKGYQGMKCSRRMFWQSYLGQSPISKFLRFLTIPSRISLVAENNALRQVRDQNAVSVTDYLTQFGLENLLESTTDHEARDLRHRSRSTLNQLSTARDRSRSGNSADSPMSAGARSLRE